MSRGLEAFKYVFPNECQYTCNEDIKYSKSVLLIEKELKALEIFVNKRVDLLAFELSNDVVGYKSQARCWCYELTQEEYDLLKEVLKDE